MGIEKARLTKKFLTARGIEIDFDASYAYAESISDLPLFEVVGRRVAVYPDPELSALAHGKSGRYWEEWGADKRRLLILSAFSAFVRA